MVNLAQARMPAIMQSKYSYPSNSQLLSFIDSVSFVGFVGNTHTCAVRLVFGRLGRVAYVCLFSISEASVLTVILFSSVIFFVRLFDCVRDVWHVG